MRLFRFLNFNLQTKTALYFAIGLLGVTLSSLFCGYRKPRVYPWMNAFGDGTMDKCNITPHPIVSTTRSIT